MYTGEQMNQVVTDILENLSDQGRVSEILSDLRTDYTETLASHEALNDEKTTLTNFNETLRSMNQKMMVKLGDFSKIVDTGSQTEPEPEPQKLKYEDLYDEKGRLR